MNRGPETANLRLLPTVWFRNTWSWGGHNQRPELYEARPSAEPSDRAQQRNNGKALAALRGIPGTSVHRERDELHRLFGAGNRTPYVKDGINNFVVNGDEGAVNPQRNGTKAAAQY